MQLKIMDDTLREGEQTPGVEYKTESRIKLFEKLVEVGIKLVNIGSPSIQHNLEGIKKISALGYNDVELVGHLGCSNKEIEKAIDCGLESIKLYIGPTKRHLTARFGERFKTLEDARNFCLNKIDEAVSYAKKRGIRTISFTAEDITSTIGFAEDANFAYTAIKTALDNGAKRISLPDTRGVATPSEVEEMMRNFKTKFSGYEVEIEGHYHNDLGLAVANALAAVKSGVNIIHTTVNGMGERVGITALEQLDAALYYGLNIDTGLKREKLYELSRMVETFSGIPVARNAPVVGDSAFTHTAGRHQHAVVNDPMTYQAIDPKLYGRDTLLAFGALTGKEGVKGFIKKCGINLDGIDDSRIIEITDGIRRYHLQNGVCDAKVAKQIIESKLGIELNLPESYGESLFQEAYLLISTKAGKDEILIKEKVMDTLKKLPYVVGIGEIFGSNEIDYIAHLRYKSGNEYPQKAKKLLASLIGKDDKITVLNVGDKYGL